MPSPVLNCRLPPALMLALDDRAKREGRTRSDVAVSILAGALTGYEDEEAPAAMPAPTLPRAKPMAKARPATQRTLPLVTKPEVARAALAQAEERTGVGRARLDTSAVPVMGQGKRPAYQRARDKVGR